MTDNTGTLEVIAHGGILELTIRRGAKRNAVNQQLADRLDEAFDRVESDPRLRAVILTGEDPCFSAGTDLASDSSPRTPAGGPYGFVTRHRRKPLIAAVEGIALGGGLEMVLACDLVVASTTATFGLPEVRRGVVANCGAFFRAPEKLPPAIAMELLLTGCPLSADRAYSLGLVNRLTEPGGALLGAREMAQRILEASPAAVAATLDAVGAARAEHEAPLWPLTEHAAARAAESPDHAEGIAAFFERRPAHWAS